MSWRTRRDCLPISVTVPAHGISLGGQRARCVEVRCCKEYRTRTPANQERPGERGLAVPKHVAPKASHMNRAKHRKRSHPVGESWCLPISVTVPAHGISLGGQRARCVEVRCCKEYRTRTPANQERPGERGLAVPKHVAPKASHMNRAKHRKRSHPVGESWCLPISVTVPAHGMSLGGQRARCVEVCCRKESQALSPANWVQPGARGLAYITPTFYSPTLGQMALPPRCCSSAQ